MTLRDEEKIEQLEKRVMKLEEKVVELQRLSKEPWREFTK